MRVSSSQSARSQMPGSRSSQRPCVSAMSSAPGAKTSKTKRPVRREEPRARRAAPRAGRRRSPCAAASGTGSATSGNVPSTGGSRMSPWRRSTLDAGELRRARARPRASPPRGRRRPPSMPGRGDRHRDPPGADAELEHRPARAHRLLDVERRRPRRRCATTGRRGARSCRRPTSSLCFAAMHATRLTLVYAAPVPGPRRALAPSAAPGLRSRPCDRRRSNLG